MILNGKKLKGKNPWNALEVKLWVLVVIHGQGGKKIEILMVYKKKLTSSGSGIGLLLTIFCFSF